MGFGYTFLIASTSTATATSSSFRLIFFFLFSSFFFQFDRRLETTLIGALPPPTALEGGTVDLQEKK